MNNRRMNQFDANLEKLHFCLGREQKQKERDVLNLPSFLQVGIVEAY